MGPTPRSYQAVKLCPREPEEEETADAAQRIAQCLTPGIHGRIDLQRPLHSCERGGRGIAIGSENRANVHGTEGNIYFYVR